MAAAKLELDWLDMSEFQIVTVKTEQEFAGRILLAQPTWPANHWRSENGNFGHQEIDLPRVWVDKCLNVAKKNNCRFVIFPELAIPVELVDRIAQWSSENNSIVIAGSHYFTLNNRTTAICPAIFGGIIHTTDKIFPAPSELSPIPAESISNGQMIKIFEINGIGKTAILICADYLQEIIRQRVIAEKLDLLVVIAFQKDSNDYYKRFDVDIDEDKVGFIIYSNNFAPKLADGGSAVFCKMDKIYSDKLQPTGRSNAAYKFNPVNFGEENSFALIEIDFENPRPQSRRNAHTRPNLKITMLESGEVEPENERTEAQSLHTTDLKVERIASLRNVLKQETRKVFTQYNIDDFDWRDAISSIYFLVRSARALGRALDANFTKLLEKFVAYVEVGIDDKITLKEGQLPITPEESRHMLTLMLSEDAENLKNLLPVKYPAEKVDVKILHRNYVYGLIYELSRQGIGKRSKLLELISEGALYRLIYDDLASVMEFHGGWHPYRTPWITARILINLSEENYKDRIDASHIDKVIRNALSSIVDRIETTPENNSLGVWKSGVAPWVSNWECTALCLEAIGRTDNTNKYIGTVQSVLKILLSRRAEWFMAKPDFSSKDTTSRTLGSVVLCSVIGTVSQKYLTTEEIVSADVMIEFLESLKETVIATASLTSDNRSQFCTVPQIINYALMMTENEPEG
jgi:hypothetical protein